MSSRHSRLTPAAGVPILWLYGADGVGKSTVGWETYSRLVDHGVAAAYVDTDYLGFCTPQFADRSRLVERNLAATWPNYAAAGAECLVVSGIVVTADERTRYERTVPGGRMTLCRLHAGSETIRARIVQRARVAAESAGGELSAAAVSGLQEYGDRSVAFAQRLEADDVSDLVLHTDRATPADLARAVLQHGEWPEVIARAAVGEGAR